jgi:type VI secretion system protein VasJ
LSGEQDYSALGKQPISDAQPAGSDVRNEDDYDTLQTEIGKMSNPAASGSIDWQQVVTLSETILSTKSKDLLVASYLTGALLQTRDLPGLLDGLRVVGDMLETYWDTLFPPLARLRGRRNALQWLIERVTAHSEEHDWSSLPPQEPELVDGLRACMQAIDAVTAEKDGEAPSMRPLLTLVGNLAVKEPPAAPAAAGSAAAPASTADSAGAGAALPATPLDSTENAEQAAGEALLRLADIAAWFNDAGSNAPMALRINRMAAWGGIDALPPVQDGRTPLPAPVQPVQDALRNLENAQANEELLRFAETQLPNFPFWLDLNRVAAQALGRLGAEHEPARREVCGQTAALLARLPDLAQLAFADGTPFADGDTRMWLQSLGGGDAAAPSADPLAGAMGTARARAADGDLAGAAASLQQAIAQTESPAARLRLRTLLCELLFAERPGANIEAFAQAILTDIDRHDLVAWDPPLALAGLVVAYPVLARDENGKPRADALLARIAALDAQAAVKLVT